MAYCTIDELKQQLAIEDTASDVDLQRAIDAAARAIDLLCGRTFALDAADQTRYFYPTRDGTVDVIDLVTITTLKVDTAGARSFTTSLTASDYELLPYNEPRAQCIRIWPTSSHGFTSGRLVQWVGKAGYVEGGALNATTGQTPVPVRQANLLLAARYFSRKDAPFGILQSTDLGQFTRLGAEDPDVKALLTHYNRNDQWVVA